MHFSTLRSAKKLCVSPKEGEICAAHELLPGSSKMDGEWLCPSEYWPTIGQQHCNEEIALFCGQMLARVLAVLVGRVRVTSREHKRRE